MNYSIRCDESGLRLIVESSGEMNAADFLMMARDLLQHPHRLKNANVIFDHRALDFSHVVLADLEKIRDFHRKHEQEIGCGKSAVVVKPGFSYEWHKMWTLGEKIKTGNKLCVFENFDDAVSWVESDTD